VEGRAGPRGWASERTNEKHNTTVVAREEKALIRVLFKENKPV
jgi:hypothetical protein